MTLFVGTSGWAYKEWKGGFYPVDLPERRFLEHYSRVLSACEVNATFYRLQSSQTFSRWVESTREGFRFAVKAHRRLTHGKDIVGGDELRDFRERFLSSVEALGDRLACILFQFPPYRERDDEALAKLLETFPSKPPCALEFRHESWSSAEVEDRIGGAGATVCLSDRYGRAPDSLPSGPFAYVRLRAERYSEADRQAWRSLLEREAAQRPVFAFAKHEGVPAGDPFTGVGLAQWLVGTTRDSVAGEAGAGGSQDFRLSAKPT